jgi:hypothetical protein
LLLRWLFFSTTHMPRLCCWGSKVTYFMHSDGDVGSVRP